MLVASKQSARRLSEEVMYLHQLANNCSSNIMLIVNRLKNERATDEVRAKWLVRAPSLWRQSCACATTRDEHKCRPHPLDDAHHL